MRINEKLKECALRMKIFVGNGNHGWLRTAKRRTENMWRWKAHRAIQVVTLVRFVLVILSEEPARNADLIERELQCLGTELNRVREVLLGMSSSQAPRSFLPPSETRFPASELPVSPYVLCLSSRDAVPCLPFLSCIAAFFS